MLSYKRLSLIRFSLIALDLKDILCSFSKTPFEFGCNSLFYTNIDNGLVEMALVICPENIVSKCRQSLFYVVSRLGQTWPICACILFCLKEA